MSKRRSCAKESLIASVAIKGTSEYRLRSLGLESVEYAVTPEATLVNILAEYWRPNVANFYTIPSIFGTPYQPARGTSSEDVAALSRRRLNDLARHIEYRLTGNPQAGESLPEFERFVDYMRYRIHEEHPDNPCIAPQYGYTDEFLQYALDESRHVFGRQ
jgi:hypothetical protein